MRGLNVPRMKRDDEDFDDADLKVAEDVASSTMLLAQQQLKSNDPKASIAPPSTRTHTVYVDTSGMPIEQQPEIRSVPELSGSLLATRRRAAVD